MRLRALAYVGVDEQDVLARGGIDGGQVARDEALALGRRGRRDHEDARVALHEVEPVAQQAEGLGHGVRAVGPFGDEVALVLGVPQGDFACQGDGGEVFDVLAAAHAHVEQMDEPEHAGGDGQTEHDAHEQDDRLARADGCGRAQGSFDQTDVGFLDGELHGHLFALVEQVSVERRFQFLLTFEPQGELFDVGQAACLPREGGQVGFGLAQLHVDGAHVAVDRGQDGFAQRGELTIQVAYGGRLLVRVVGQVVALQHLRVVFADGRGKGRVAQSRQGGDNFAVVALVGDEAREEACHRLLRFELQGAVVGVEALVHEGLGVLLEVDNLVAALEVGQTVFGVGQFGPHDGRAVFDEAHGALGHAVFVGHDVAHVGVVELVQHVLGPLSARVVTGQYDERTFLVILGRAHLAAVKGRGGHQGQVRHADLLPARKLVERLSPFEGEHAGGRGYRAARLHLVGLGVAVGAHAETAQHDGAVVAQLHVEAGRLGGLVFEAHAHGRVFIKGDGAQVPCCRVVDVEAERVDHVFHQSLRGKDENLVLQVVAHADAVHFEQRAHGRARGAPRREGRAAFGVLDEHDALPLEHLRLPFLVKVACGHAYHEREGEPFPLAPQRTQAAFHHPGQVDVFFLINLLRFVVLHIRCFGMLVRIAWSEYYTVLYKLGFCAVQR